MKPARVLPRSATLLSYRDLLDFPIPTCSHCGERMVRLGVKWVCKTDTKVRQVQFVEELIPTPDGLVKQLSPHVELVPVVEAFPNRKARRAA